MEELVSVIMPVCNNEKYLSTAIESILNQSYENIELLILDDGSNDKSLSIIEKYALDNKCIRIISRDNKGVANSISELIKYSNGEYIARMDGDDISYLNRIETQVKYLKENPDVSLVGTYVDIELSDYKNDDDKIMCEKIFNFKIDKDNPSIKILNGYRICHGSFLGRADLFKKIDYNTALKSSEDIDFVFNVIKQNFKLDIIPKKLYLNRVNSEFVHEQKHLDSNYNQEILISKIKFLEENLLNREIILFGKNKYSEELYEIIKNDSRFKVKKCDNNIELEKLNDEYVIILDKQNHENIEHKLISNGRKNLKDFITL